MGMNSISFEATGICDSHRLVIDFNMRTLRVFPKKAGAEEQGPFLLWHTADESLVSWGAANFNHPNGVPFLQVIIAGDILAKLTIPDAVAIEIQNIEREGRN